MLLYLIYNVITYSRTAEIAVWELEMVMVGREIWTVILLVLGLLPCVLVPASAEEWWKTLHVHTL